VALSGFQGGRGYYDLIKTINKAPFEQPASFFCLRTSDERWQFLAMDTGLHDYSPMSVSDAITYIEPDELEWHSQRIEEFPGKTVLLSHHQLFSAFSTIGSPVDGKRSPTNPKLYEAFRRLNNSNKVTAWFWGHEHTLSIYEPFLGLERGRCIGNGAVPTSIIDKIYEPLKDLDQTPSIKKDTQLSPVGGVYAHGYAVVSLSGGTCSRCVSPRPRRKSKHVVRGANRIGRRRLLPFLLRTFGLCAECKLSIQELVTRQANEMTSQEEHGRRHEPTRRGQR
jgi:hypothetical protein